MIRQLFKKYIFLFVLIALTILCRAYNLGGESIYGDEGYSIYYSQQHLKELVPFFLKDQNPPMHMILLHYWMKIFGVSDVSAKALSVLFSLLAAVMLFAFSKKFLNRTATILVSVLFLASNAQQFYATEVRTYALIQLLCICSFYVYFRLLEMPKKKYIFLLALLSLLLLFSHYLTIYIFIVQFACSLLFLKQNKKGVVFYIISQALAFLIFIPWLKIMLGNIPKTGSFWNHSPNVADLRWHVNILNGNESLFYVFSAIVICSLIMVLLNKKLRFFSEQFKTRYYIIFLLLYLVPIALNFFISQYTPVFLGRYILYSTFGLFLLTAYVISCLDTTRTLKAITFVPLLYLLVVSFKIKQEREDNWKAIVPQVKEQQSPHSVILISASYKYREFAFYYDREAFKDYTKTIARLAAKSVYCSKKDEAYSWDKLNFDTISRVIYVQSHSQFEDPEGKIKQHIIANGFKLCDFYSEINVAYSVYIRDSMDCHTVQELGLKPVPVKGFIRTEGFIDGLKDTVRIFRADSLKQAAVSKINTKNPYGFGFGMLLNELGNPQKVYVSALVSSEKEKASRLVFSVERKGKELSRNEILLSEGRLYRDAKEGFAASFMIPAGMPKDAELKVYFWNPGTSEVLIEDVQLIIQSRRGTNHSD